MKETKKNHRKQPPETGTFPYESLDFSKTKDMLWLKSSAIDTSITGIVFADLKGRMFYANEAAVLLWRCKEPSDYINQFAGTFSRSKARSMEILDTVLTKGVWTGEFDGVRMDGTFNHFYLQMNLVRNRRGKPICLMYAFMDITDKKALQEQVLIKDVAIEKSVTGIILTDLDGVITFINDATAVIWGYEKSEMLGKYSTRFAQSKDHVLNVFHIVHREGSWKGEIGGVRKDGTIIWTHMSASLIRDIADEPVCIMCSFVDVTEQKHLREQMRIKENALASSINGMVITDFDRNIIYVNDAFYGMWGGQSPNEVIGNHIKNFAGSKDDSSRIYQAIIDSGKWRGETKIKRKDGSSLDVQCFVNSVTGPDKDSTCIFFSFIDITDRKTAERELKESHDQLEIRVMDRTKELQILNRENLKEIEERKNAEKRLLQKEKDLIEKSMELEEMNAALKVLLRQREKDRENLEIDVFTNIEKNIFPYLNKLLNSQKLGIKEKKYLLTIESNINNVVSPFLRKLQTTYQKLTPTEIQVANLIRDDKSTKEIAVLLDTSIRAIEFHRKNIRTKLNLTNMKANLKSHLMSLI